MIIFQIMGVSIDQYRAEIGRFVGGRSSCAAPFESFERRDDLDRR